MPHKQNSHYTEYVTFAYSTDLSTSLVDSHDVPHSLTTFNSSIPLSLPIFFCICASVSSGMCAEISALQMVLRSTISSYRLLLGTNVAALKYMKREIDTKKEESMISYDFSVYDNSGSNAGMNIKRIEGGQESVKGKKDDGKKKKRKSDLNVGNGNAIKQNRR